MAKKTLKKKVQAKPDLGKYAAPVVDSARDIWLAGLGAFSMAQQEGGKLFEQGNKLFEKLVSEGAKLEKKTRDMTGSTLGEVRGSVESKVGAVRQQAADNWDKLEDIFEDRVARVLGRLGVPTAEDVHKLSGRVQELSKQVAAMAASTNGKKKAGTRKTKARKAPAPAKARPAAETKAAAEKPAAPAAS